MPIQQMLLGVGAVAKKTYVDDVFSTFLYKGNGSSQSINNGMDLSSADSDGGMVWIKGRGSSHGQEIFDTVRGALKDIRADRNNEQETLANSLTAFNSNGFSVGSVTGVNQNDISHAAWTFLKAPGFFDVVTWTGNNSNSRQISHSLGCVPGCIMIKRLNHSADWRVYHRGLNGGVDPYDSILVLNSNAAENDVFDNLLQSVPTATTFTLGDNSDVNASSGTYVAYLFAGGESTASGARSVDFDGTDDYLSIADNDDFDVGTNWTAEAWFKADSLPGSYNAIMGQWSGTGTSSWVVEYVGSDLRFYYKSSGQTTNYKTFDTQPALGQWHHVAISKSGTTTRCFLNGVQSISDFDMLTHSASSIFTIGGNINSGGWFDGQISNVRIVKGTAVYTSSFRPPTEPLTNITNTKLLCCNNSSTTGSTVTPGTITAGSSPTASTDSPFDDPAGFVFGDAGDQNVIKCGSYVGNGSTDGPEINLGWEPQWILLKNTASEENWFLWDSMRGIVTGGNDSQLHPNTTGQEVSSHNRIDLTSTGFKVVSNDGSLNESGATIIYTCIRRSDGYCGKPPELGTDVFAMDTGNGSSTIPTFDTTFPVDFAISRTPASSANWSASARLMQKKYLSTNLSNAEASWSVATFDSNVGYSKVGDGNTTQAWMWKRHAGFDVVTYVGNQTSGHHIAHSCGQTPEMIWTKNRDQTQSWHVGHKDLNGGTNPWDYQLVLSDSPNEQENVNTGFWEAPTATHFTVGSDARVNRNNDDYLAILFSSVNGISKVGSYTGSSSALTITTGFQPRFIIIKNASSNSYDSSTDWFVFDTTRGWASGNNDKLLRLNEDDAQTTEDWTDPTSTGFTINADSGNDLNNNGDRYIYYAHA